MGGKAGPPVLRDLGDRKAWAASSEAEVPIFLKLSIRVPELPSRTILGALCLGPFASFLCSCSKGSGLHDGLSPAPGSTCEAIRTLTSPQCLVWMQSPSMISRPHPLYLFCDSLILRPDAPGSHSLQPLCVADTALCLSDNYQLPFPNYQKPSFVQGDSVSS